MTDVHSTETRSFNMSRIRSKDTKPELIVRKFLFSQGFRYKLHDKSLPGKPDIVLPKYKTVIFIHGCFWHGHEGCSHSMLPQTRTEWWAAKISANKIRDDRTYLKLVDDGWHVLTIWNCQLKKMARHMTLEQLASLIKMNDAS